MRGSRLGFLTLKELIVLGVKCAVPGASQVIELISGIQNGIEHAGHKDHISALERQARVVEDHMGLLATQLSAIEAELAKTELINLYLIQTINSFGQTVGNPAKLIDAVNEWQGSAGKIFFGEGAISKSRHLEAFHDRPQDFGGSILGDGEAINPDDFHIMIGSEAPRLIAINPNRFVELLESNESPIPFKLYTRIDRFCAIAGPKAFSSDEQFLDPDGLRIFTSATKLDAKVPISLGR